MEYSATTGRLSLSLLGLEGESLGSGALRHATTTINSSLALGDDGVILRPVDVLKGIKFKTHFAKNLHGN